MPVSATVVGAVGRLSVAVTLTTVVALVVIEPVVEAFVSVTVTGCEDEAHSGLVGVVIPVTLMSYCENVPS